MTPQIEGLAAVIGHRGAAGHAPENTVTSVRRAAGLGARWVEIDVRLTADGRLVLMHDASLERTTNGAGLVAEATLAEIAALDAGAWYAPEFAGELVPTLEEFLDACRELDLRANIEIKAGETQAVEVGVALGTFLESEFPAHDSPALISSISTAALDSVLGATNRFPCGVVCPGAIPRDAELAAWCDRFASVHASAAGMTEADVERAKSQGFVVMAFTVNDAETAARLYGWGVDAIFSDYPDRLLRT